MTEAGFVAIFRSCSLVWCPCSIAQSAAAAGARTEARERHRQSGPIGIEEAQLAAG
jgi:hypothetical protein